MSYFIPVRLQPAILATAILAACAGQSVVAADIARLRSATRSFQQLDSAVAAGYPRTVADCLVHEHHGAMGYHHLNRNYLTRNIDVDKPQILLYEKMC